LYRTQLLIACLLLAGLAGSAVAPGRADPAAASVEPTREDCMAAVERARALADALPAGDGSRYFAERHLQQAMTEAGNREFDDCLEWAQRAMEEVQEHRHTLAPGETIKVRGADE
jgi:hypothetical protein